MNKLHEQLVAAKTANASFEKSMLEKYIDMQEHEISDEQAQKKLQLNANEFKRLKAAYTRKLKREEKANEVINRRDIMTPEAYKTFKTAQNMRDMLLKRLLAISDVTGVWPEESIEAKQLKKANQLIWKMDPLINYEARSN